MERTAEMILLWLSLYELQVSSGLHFEITENYMGDPEPYRHWAEPPSPEIWESYVVDAQYMGLLFAGRAEFSWIVDLRVDNTEPEDWSTGNLITSNKVLTTCRAAKKLEQLHKTFAPAKATFCQMYMWEHTMGNRRWHYSGVRQVKSYEIHRHCDLGTLTTDVGVLTLDSGVQMSPPFVDVMPVIVNPRNHDVIPKVNLTRMVVEKRICYVASIGRPYVNWRYHLVQDFKVKYRVYFEEWPICTNQINKLCDKGELQCDVIFNAEVAARNDVMCFRSRAKVGTVCDHDRGSPLVCDREVVGLVLLGANYSYCNDRLPMPFIVSQISKFQEFLNKFTIYRKPYNRG